jgi:lipoyl(octanoyl) transferase
LPVRIARAGREVKARGGCYNGREMSATESAMRERVLRVRRLGLVPYGEAYRVQKETERDVRDGRGPDTLLLVEHPHVVTLGRRADSSALLATRALLEARGVHVVETDRGGRATYHGPGQVVGYPVISLRAGRADVHRYVRDLERTIIAALSDFGIEGFTVEGLTGVHTSRGKVAAIGIHVARWVTTHGFALNVNTDLSYFQLILPCDGEHVTSMEQLLGREVEMRAIEDRLAARFAEVFGMTAGEEGQLP